MTAADALYKLLEAVDCEQDGRLAALLRATGHPDLTVCPACGQPDFMHADGCRLDAILPARKGSACG